MESSSALMVDDDLKSSIVIQEELVANINGTLSQAERFNNSQITTSDKNGSMI